MYTPSRLLFSDKVLIFTCQDEKKMLACPIFIETMYEWDRDLYIVEGEKERYQFSKESSSLISIININSEVKYEQI